MKKTIPAFIAALLITLVLGGGMFLMGQDALGTSTAKADAAASAQVSNVTAAQYEQVVSQYQAREAQYQEMIAQASRQITTANQQIDLANQQLQQYQTLIQQLQSSGLVTIASDGTVTINQSSQSAFMQPPANGRHNEGNH
ncbi:MAG: hypothetical protein H6634_13875 [Anaerolineales bacterium]|nr:hypothetical protein [Anaerolineales bacterium]